MFGFVNVNKPKNRTSRSAVNAILKFVKPGRVGHAGTLDPLATGVLVVCVGPATRLTKFVQAMPKTYVANFRLGFESDTEDIYGDVKEILNANTVSQDEMEKVLPDFTGTIQQLPPKFSALKVQGKRAYDLARAGKEVVLEPRPVEIHSLKVTCFDFPNFQLEIQCGSGTYVRSLGRDIGQRLGSGAIMTGLERTAIGGFRSSEGISIDDLSRDFIEQNLVPPQIGIPDFPQVRVLNDQIQKFINGHAWEDETLKSDEVFAIDESNRLLTLLRKRKPGFYTPAVNFSKYWLDQEKAH